MSFSKIVLSGQVANIEREIDDLKEKLEPIQKRLSIAYEYKDSLYDAMKQADDRIKEVQGEFFDCVNKIHGHVNKMKEVVLNYQPEI